MDILTFTGPHSLCQRLRNLKDNSSYKGTPPLTSVVLLYMLKKMYKGLCGFRGSCVKSD